MLQYKRINVSQEIDINKSNKSNECVICHYKYFFKSYESELYNECHDILMMAYNLENIAILNIKGVDYRKFIWNMNGNVAINMLNNS